MKNYLKLLIMLACSMLPAFSMDRPEAQESMFSRLPPELKQELILALIAQADSKKILLSDLVENNRRVVASIIEQDNLSDDDLVASKKYIKSVWRDVFSALSAHKETRSWLEDEQFKKKLFLELMHRLFDDNLQAIYLYNDEIVAIARTLGLKLNSAYGPQLQAVDLLVSLGVDPDGKYSEIFARALTVFNNLVSQFEFYQDQRMQQGVSADAKVTEQIVHNLNLQLRLYDALISYLLNKKVAVPRGYEDEYGVYKNFGSA